MSKSRWGGFRNGRRRYTNSWDDLRTPNAASQSVAAPTSPTDFNYTDAQGIWNLTSTVNFRGTLSGGAPSYTTGFSESLDAISGQLDGWRQRTVNISSYAGATVRLTFHYVSGSSFTGDIQLDAINLDGNSYSFESGTESFQTSVSGETNYNSVSWNSLAMGEVNGRWNRDSGGTSSGNTARTDAADGTFYVFAETTGNGSGFPSRNFWLRSPQIVLGNTPTLTYFETRLGATIGTLNVHLDVIA